MLFVFWLSDDGVATAATENGETEKKLVVASNELAHNAEKLKKQVVDFLATVRQ